MLSILFSCFAMLFTRLTRRLSKFLHKICLWNMWDKDPPGPLRLPIIGNAYVLGKIFHESLYNLTMKYGPFFKLDIFGQGAVVVSDATLLKELLSLTSSSGRGDLRYIFDVIGSHGLKHGIVIGEGSHWEELRRFTLRSLRDFGVGKTSMEESIMVEVRDFNSRISDGCSVSDVKERLMIAVVNSLWSIVAGQRRDHDDERTKRFIGSIESTFAYLQNDCSPITLISSWFSLTFPKWSGYGEFRRRFDGLVKNYFLSLVEEHRTSLDPTFDRDFIDMYLRQVDKHGDSPNSAFYKDVGLDHLQQVLFDLYIAGADTASNTLAFSILYLSKSPGVQAQLADEIGVVSGNYRPCCLADRASMPFTEAVLAETMRLSSIVPQSIIHRAEEDIPFHGYTIPKGTSIFPNLNFIHHDPEVWEEPWEFKPERFLSDDGKSFVKHEALLPFSTGRRKCLGENLARDTLFLFLTNTFQKWQVYFDGDGPENDCTRTMGLTLTPKPFHVIFKERLRK